MKKVLMALLAGLVLSAAAFTPEAHSVAKNALSGSQQAIVHIAAMTASGDMERLKLALNEGLDAGLSINEIKEVLVQLYAYAGFPRSLNALDAFSATLQEREKKGLKDKSGPAAKPLLPGKSSLELGTEVQTALVGAPVKGGLMDFAPAIDTFLKAHLFGDIFGRDNLDWKSRELATLGALSNMNGVESQLRSHFAISMNIGLTPEQLDGVIFTLERKVGVSVSLRAGKILQAVKEARK